MITDDEVANKHRLVCKAFEFLKERLYSVRLHTFLNLQNLVGVSCVLGSEIQSMKIPDDSRNIIALVATPALIVGNWRVSSEKIKLDAGPNKREDISHENERRPALISAIYRQGKQPTQP